MMMFVGYDSLWFVGVGPFTSAIDQTHGEHRFSLALSHGSMIFLNTSKALLYTLLMNFQLLIFNSEKDAVPTEANGQSRGSMSSF